MRWFSSFAISAEIGSFDARLKSISAARAPRTWAASEACDRSRNSTRSKSAVAELATPRATVVLPIPPGARDGHER